MSVAEYDYCPDCGHRVRLKTSKGTGFNIQYGKFFGMHFVRSYDWQHCKGSEKEVKRAKPRTPAGSSQGTLG